MIDELNTALKGYFTKWDVLVTARKDQAFFTDLKPVAVGWKVADRAEYDKLCTLLHDQSVRIIETWMNGRWIAKVQLKDDSLERGMKIIKVMQRRPGSKDALGLDHVDFYSPKVVDGEAVLKQETDLQWSQESNDIIAGYEWLSIWFEGTEAKIKAGTVFDIIIAELKEVNTKLTKD